MRSSTIILIPFSNRTTALGGIAFGLCDIQMATIMKRELLAFNFRKA